MLYVPSLILTKVRTLPHLELPPPAPVITEDDTFSGQTIVLTKHAGGSYYDHHYASLLSDGQEIKGLVVLMRDLSHSVPVQQEFVKRDLVDKMFFYERLASVQGRFVPRFGGLFNHGTLYCMVFEDAGRRLSYREDFTVEGIKYVARSTSLTCRNELLETVKGINGAGVIVQPTRWSYFNRGTDGAIRMANFDPFEVETMENFSPEFYATAAAKGWTEMGNETPEETFARWAEDGRDRLCSEMFND